MIKTFMDCPYRVYTQYNYLGVMACECMEPTLMFCEYILDGQYGYIKCPRGFQA